ncbi:MAG: hypothetical protein VX270_04985, partial [Actinomycetota bacterium]|nr:hypothetical protein [Actinomycetota bacterium]
MPANAAHIEASPMLEVLKSPPIEETMGATLLSSFDDYYIHQTSRPIATPATTDRNAYDRSFFNGYTDTGDLYFGISSARYPNLEIQDCALTVVHGGQQPAFHGSRRAPRDPHDMSTGPFRIEILEPMMTLRVVLEDNDTGIGADLHWIPRTAHFPEDHQSLTPQQIGRWMISTRMNQFGFWRGEIRLPNETITVDPERTFGTKDRSWGVRPVGDPNSVGAPRRPKGFKFFWAPLHWPHHVTHMGIFEGDSGEVWHWDGFQLPAYSDPVQIPGIEDPKTERLNSVAHDFTWKSGTRNVSGGTLTMEPLVGDPIVVELEPLLSVRMKGMGYGHPEWGHGFWKGELAIAGESWDLDDIDPLAIENLHIQEVIKVRSGESHGVGVLEQLVVGPYPRYGFAEFLDGAP